MTSTRLSGEVATCAAGPLRTEDFATNNDEEAFDAAAFDIPAFDVSINAFRTFEEALAGFGTNSILATCKAFGTLEEAHAGSEIGAGPMLALVPSKKCTEFFGWLGYGGGKGTVPACGMRWGMFFLDGLMQKWLGGGWWRREEGDGALAMGKGEGPSLRGTFF